MESKKDGSYYIGQTADLSRRIKWHNMGNSRYTKNKIPWELKYVEEYDSRKEAVRREREIKRKKSRKYIKYLISRGVAQSG